MPKRVQPCGTNAAYKRHVRAGEPACNQCLKAHTLYERERLGGPTNLVVLPGMDRYKDPVQIRADAAKIDIAAELKEIYLTSRAVYRTSTRLGSVDVKELSLLESSMRATLKQLVELETTEEASIGDELAAVRRDRAART